MPLLPDMVVRSIARSTPWVLAFIAAIACNPLSLSAAEQQPAAFVVAVDDYASIPPAVLAQATDTVTRIYSAIGVDVCWLDERSVSDGGRRRPMSAPQKLTLVIFNDKMTAVRALPDDVVGSAPGTRSGRGRVAYVYYDRVIRLASSPDSGADWLSLVMAHELGHLLLPYGSHSEDGVMRGRWDVEEFRHVDVGHLGFTPFQADEIRRRATPGQVETPSGVPGAVEALRLQ